jgi:HAD superfamily hydrolase (TIGR01509 family)
VADVSHLEAVLFDMDGLLVDTEDAWGTAEAKVVAELGGPPWTDDEVAMWVGGPISRVGEYMVARSGSEQTPQAVADRLVEVMADLLAHGADHRPGAEALLADLRRHAVPTALVSSSPRVLVAAVLASVGGDAFDVTIAGDEVERTKPHPDPYLRACRLLGAEPARAVVLEDSPVGVAAAEAAGCLVVAVPFVVPIEQAPRRHVVPSLEHLDTQRLAALVAADLGGTP